MCQLGLVHVHIATLLWVANVTIISKYMTVHVCRFSYCMGTTTVMTLQWYICIVFPSSLPSSVLARILNPRGFGLYNWTNLLIPTWLSCYTFGELTFNSLSKGSSQEGKILHKRQQCLHVMHWFSKGYGYSPRGEPPHKRLARTLEGREDGKTIHIYHCKVITVVVPMQ